VFHPFVVIPLTVLALGLRHSTGQGAGTRAVVVTLLLIAPVLALIAMRVRSGVWSDYDVSIPGHRAPFYRQALVALSLGSSIIGWFMPELRRGLVAGWALLIASMAANRYLKSSLHVAFASFCAVMLSDRLVTATACLAAVLVLAWSRVTLGRHRPAEVLSGALLGAFAGAALRAWG
jgi:membrane-associated phospholipid phosphatase